MYFLTFNDQPSGIYQSQVIDVVKYLSKLSGNDVTLIAFLPLQGFKENKKCIRSQYKKSLVLPMVFGITRWRKHRLLLKIFTNRKRSVITRGPLANALSQGCFRKVVYDGRAAVKAEVEEYDITSGNMNLNKDLIQAERNAVLKSDYRIAVSEKLVNYWQKEIGYNEDKYVVIPCTLSEKSTIKINAQNEKDTITIVYSGSTSGWQSFDKVVVLLEDLLNRQANINVLFLTKANESIAQLIQKYPTKVKTKFVSHHQVAQELSQCDYGILIRDNKITNQVASPVKFAEYLNTGLKVLISPQIGDFSDFVKENNCGIIIENEIPILEKIENQQKEHSKNLVTLHFLKSSNRIQNSYTLLLKSLST